MNSKKYVKPLAWILVMVLALPAGAWAQDTGAPPTFKQEELDQIKRQWTVYFHDQMTDPEAVASEELSRLIYPPGHPNYEPRIGERLKALDETTLDDIREFYEQHYGNNDFILVAAGDVNVPELTDNIRRNFDGWQSKTLSGNFPRQVSMKSPERKTIRIEGKRNLDVFFGHGIPMVRKDKQYPALALASFALGGDFSSRLTAKVRDTLGLTYSVYSQLDGLNGDLEGEWLIHLITTPHLLKTATMQTFSEIERFAAEGISEKELTRNQNTVSGRHQVYLSTTGALAERILRAEEDGLGIDYVDDFPDRIKSLSLGEVNQAIAKYFHPDKLNVVIAGDDRRDNSAG